MQTVVEFIINLFPKPVSFSIWVYCINQLIVVHFDVIQMELFVIGAQFVDGFPANTQIAWIGRWIAIFSEIRP